MRTSSFGSELRTAVGSLGLLGVLLATGSCAKKADIPDPPDVSPLVAKYDAPDGQVNARSLASALSGAVQLAGSIAGTGLAVYLRDLVQRVREAAAQSQAAENTSGRLQSPDVQLDAHVTVTRTCSGWNPADTTPNPGLNGQVLLNGVVKNDIALPTVWGNTLGRCLQTVQVDGQPLKMFVDGSIVLQNVSPEAPLFVTLSGKFGSENALPALDGTADFRVLSNGQVEVRAHAPDGGDVIVFFGNGEAGMRGANGRFICSVEQRLCTGPDGRSIQW